MLYTALLSYLRETMGTPLLVAGARGSMPKAESKRSLTATVTAMAILRLANIVSVVLTFEQMGVNLVLSL
jgi:hypothetical protein